MLLLSFFTGLVKGDASDESNVGTKPQFQPPKSKMVDVSINCNM